MTTRARATVGPSAPSSTAWRAAARPPERALGPDLATLIAPLLAGAAAGYAVAIPVGAIAVLIVEMGLRRGFRLGAAAGAGAATADGIYATLAVLGGAAVAAAVAAWVVPLRAAAVVVLLLIAGRGFAAARARSAAMEAAPAGSTSGRGFLGTYTRFLGLTLLNPMTVVYFAALVLALPVLDDGPWTRVAFAAAAFVASLSWQLLLAAAGAVAHRRLPARFQVWLSIAGNAVIVAFALLIARDLVAG